MATHQDFVVRVVNTFLTVADPDEDQWIDRMLTCRARSCPPRDLSRAAASVDSDRAQREDFKKSHMAQGDQSRLLWADIQEECEGREAGRIGNHAQDGETTDNIDMRAGRGIGEMEKMPPKAVVLKNIPNRVKERDMLAAIVSLGFRADLVRLDLPVRLDKRRLQNKGFAFAWFADRVRCEQFQHAVAGFSFGHRGSQKAIVATLVD